jgi:hypothetical protein
MSAVRVSHELSRIVLAYQMIDRELNETMLKIEAQCVIAYVMIDSDM